MGCDVLVVGAFHPEVAGLRELLGPGLGGKVGGLRVEARVVGIGAPLAAAGTATQLAELLPRWVIAVGTCGAYAGSGLTLGDVVVASRVELAAPCVVDGLAQFPQPMSLVSEPHAATRDALVRAGGKAGAVASTLAITIDDAAAARLARSTHAVAEHLEAHGVATACAARGVPFGAALGVANFVGSGARDEWRVHHRAAAAAAIAVVERWLRGGGA